MPRTPVVTRAAVADDIPVLLALWQELKLVGARSERVANPGAMPDPEGRLAEVLARDDCRIVIAFIGDEPAGTVMFQAVKPDPLSDNTVLQMLRPVVAPGFRRRGVGHALVCAAADIADEMGLDHVAVGIYPSLREVSRFYARLGFAQVMVQRVAPVPVLRRRLSGDVTALRIEDLVRRRSRMRRPVPPQRLAR